MLLFRLVPTGKLLSDLAPKLHANRIAGLWDVYQTTAENWPILPVSTREFSLQEQL